MQFESALGSYGTQRESLGYQGPFGDTRVTLGYTHFETDGYRNHSSAQRDSINSKFNFLIGSAGKLSLVVNYYDSPYAQDPLGLSWAQVQQNRRQATPTASQFDSRKSTGQSQLGLVYQRDFGTPGLLQVSSYGGQRQVLQFLAIPVVTQSNPRHSGGVVDLSSDYFGSDARWTWKHDVLGRPLTLVGGLNGETLRQHRRGYENFQGSTLGVQGKLRRDEIDTVTSVDQYLQVDWLLTSRWSLDAGLRHSEVHFRSDDHYVTAQNPNDSGRVRYGAFTPVAGLLWRATDTAHFYLSYGTGFETPTFAELAYRPDGSAGLNFDLHAARSRNAELGGKFRLAYATRLDAAIFRADSRNELVTVTNSGGRATFANATRTRRQGAELSLTSSVLRTLDFTLAATLLDAAVREGYVTCTTAPCTTPQTVVARGNQLPGVAQGQIATRLSWSPTPAWSGAIEYRYLDAVPVNDTNSEAAPSYGVVDLATRYTLHNQQWKLTASLRIDNLLAEHYIGSVIVNDGNGRFYEPAPGRSLVAGLTLSFAP